MRQKLIKVLLITCLVAVNQGCLLGLLDGGFSGGAPAPASALIIVSNNKSKRKPATPVCIPIPVPCGPPTRSAPPLGSYPSGPYPGSSANAYTSASINANSKWMGQALLPPFSGYGYGGSYSQASASANANANSGIGFGYANAASNAYGSSLYGLYRPEFDGSSASVSASANANANVIGGESGASANANSNANAQASSSSYGGQAPVLAQFQVHTLVEEEKSKAKLDFMRSGIILKMIDLELDLDTGTKNLLVINANDINFTNIYLINNSQIVYNHYYQIIICRNLLQQQYNKIIIIPYLYFVYNYDYKLFQD